MTTKNKKTPSINKGTKQEPKKRGVVYIPAELPTIYVNHAQIVFTGFDAAILAGELDGLTDNGNIAVHPRAKLIMSHNFLRELGKLIERNLEMFDKDKEINPLAKPENNDSESQSNE